VLRDRREWEHGDRDVRCHGQTLKKSRFVGFAGAVLGALLGSSLARRFANRNAKPT
jgi:hypothetical protein